MKEKFIKSTIILIIGGIVTKILGMLNKIVLTRYLGTEGIGIYMLILPTFILFINLASFGFPIAISKLVSEDDKNNKKLVSTSIIFILFINLILIFILLLFGRFLSIHLLHAKRCIYGIISIIFVIPFTSISSILRSYFFGKEKMLPHIISNITEDLVRILIIFLLLKYFKTNNISISVSLVVLINVISELSSILVLFFFLPKNFKLTKKDIKPSKLYLKEELSISIPTTLTRLTGSICYFLEPIIMSSVLLFVGYSNTYIVHEYGVLSGYAIPIILLPSFFSMAISQALLPTISKLYKKKDIRGVKRKIKQGIIYSLLIGIIFTIFLEIKPKLFLKFIYNTTEGKNYIRFLAPICLFQYIQAPISSALDGIGMSKLNFKANLIGVLIRLIFLPLLSLLKIGLWSLVLSTSINMIAVTIINLKQIKRNLV